MVKLRFRLGLRSYREAVSTQHGTLEYGSDLHVNEHQKIRHCRTIDLLKNKNKKNKNKNKECQMAIFYFALSARKHCYYGYVIHSFDWKLAVEHDGGI